MDAREREVLMEVARDLPVALRVAIGAVAAEGSLMHVLVAGHALAVDGLIVNDGDILAGEVHKAAAFVFMALDTLKVGVLAAQRVIRLRVVIEAHFLPALHLMAIQAALGELARVVISMALDAAIGLHLGHQVNRRLEIHSIGELLAAHIRFGQHDGLGRELVAIGALEILVRAL